MTTEDKRLDPAITAALLEFAHLTQALAENRGGDITITTTQLDTLLGGFEKTLELADVQAGK